MSAGGSRVVAPLFDGELSLSQRAEDLTVEELIAQLSIERLDVAILPRVALRDESGPGPGRGNPVLHGGGNKI